MGTRQILSAALVAIALAGPLTVSSALATTASDIRTVHRLRCERWEGVVSAIAQLQHAPGKLAEYRAQRIDPVADEAPHIHRFLVQQLKLSQEAPYDLLDSVLTGTWLDACMAELGRLRT